MRIGEYRVGQCVHIVVYDADNRTVLYRGNGVVEQNTVMCRHNNPERCLHLTDPPMVLVRGNDNHMYGVLNPGHIRVA